MNGELFIASRYKDYFSKDTNKEMDLIQVFGYDFHKTKHSITFDADFANLLIKANPRPDFQTEDKFLKDVAEGYDKEDVKVKYADLSKPGICVEIMSDDFVTPITILIDGHHRAIKAHQEKWYQKALFLVLYWHY